MNDIGTDVWDWEFFERAITPSLYSINDHGPLFGPVTSFSIVRNDALDLILTTTSKSNSISDAVELPAGTVDIAVEEVKLSSFYGSSAIASGVIPLSHQKSFGNKASPGVTTQVSSIDSLSWRSHLDTTPSYIVEWVENMPTEFQWPDLDRVSTEWSRTRTLHGREREVTISGTADSGSSSHSCIHLVIDGIELFTGISRAKVSHINKPGFILYHGTPDEVTRKKIRECLSFCLGSFLLYLGETSFDAKWVPTSFQAIRGHALVDEAAYLSGSPPAPLSTKREFELVPEMLSRMVSGLYAIYDTYNLRNVFWNYWHALAAPVHMSAAHFGAAIEGIQKTFFRVNKSRVDGKIVGDKRVWKDLLEKMTACVEQANLTADQKRILQNKTANLNSAPQSVVMERFFESLGLGIGALETDVWQNRNSAAHGDAGVADDGIRLVRENKVLNIMMNRILLSLGDGADTYYDYYTLGRPTLALSTAVADDRPPEPEEEPATAPPLSKL